MNPEKFYIPAKIALLLPLLAGLINIAELFLPLEKVPTAVIGKHIKENSKSGTTYAVDFIDNNDQFTETIYNQVQQGDAVVLEVMRFSKEVRAIQLVANGEIMQNDTNEIYFQVGFAVVLLIVSIYFLRKKYYTNKNYLYIGIASLLGLVILIRIISLNT